MKEVAQVFREEAIREFRFNPYDFENSIQEIYSPGYYWQYAELKSYALRLKESGLVRSKVWNDLQRNLPNTVEANVFKSWQPNVCLLYLVSTLLHFF